jgi:hypothetical protein
VNYHQYIVDYIKGMGIWVLKEDKISPEHPFRQILVKNTYYQPDYYDYIQKVCNITDKDTADFDKKILNASRFSSYVSLDSDEMRNKILYDEAKVRKELSRLRVTQLKHTAKFAYCVLKPLMRKLIPGLYLDDGSLERMRELSKDRKNRVVLMPIYKSFADPLILHYINFRFGM